MADSQVIFRVNKKMLKELDASLAARGFKTRNEWFRHEIREFLEVKEHRKTMELIEKLTLEGTKERGAAQVVKGHQERQKAGEEIMRIKETVKKVLKKHGVKKAALFGSVVRGELTQDSDIDVLVEFEGRKSLLDLAGLKNELEDELKRKVDVLTYNSLHPLLKDSILKEQEIIV